MAFTFTLPKFIHSAKSSRKSSKASSKASSVNQVAPALPAYSQKYQYDPMRYNERPDYVGSFVDPMGGRNCYYHSYDVTNTGA